MDERVDAEPEDDEEGHHGGELEPGTSAQSKVPDATTGKSPGSRLMTATKGERKAMPSSTPAKATQMGMLSFS